MKLGISGWAIKNPIPVVVLFIGLLIAGAAGYASLPIKLYPDVSFPIVSVTVPLPGAAASELETQVTRQVEAATSNVAGVKHVTSTVSQGASTTTVEFEIGEDPQKATDEIRSAIDGIRSSLPTSILEPIVQRFDFDSAPIVTYAVSAPGMSDLELSWLIDDTIARSIITEKGVAQVDRIGGIDRVINVTLDPDRMQALGLTASQVNNALRSANADVPGGRAEVGGREQTLRVLAAAETVEGLKNTVLSTGGGRSVRLSDIATVSSGAAERRGYAELGGRTVVGFQVTKTKKASDVNVAKAVERATEKLAEQLPGVSFSKIVSTAENTQHSFDATLHALIEGMLLASLVVFFFLRNWRATAIAAAAMPISLIPTFWAMNAMGFSLNLITLLALTLVIGILVDDAIVEIENIQKRIERGESPYRASLFGADEIGLAVLATTATIIVVFLPVSLMGGFAGQFFKEFGFTVAVSVFFSLMVARLLTPLMAAYLLKPSKTPHEPKPFKGFYRNALDFALSHRWLSVGVGGAIFIGSLVLAATIPSGFTPPEDNGIVELSVEAAPGSTLEDMRRTNTLLTGRLMAMPDVETVFSRVGGNGGVGSAALTVLLKDERSQTTQEFQSEVQPLFYEIPDVRIGFGGAGGGSSVTIVLVSEDADALSSTALQLEREMRGIAGLTNAHQLSARPSAELVVTPKLAEAARLGVTADAIAAVARVSTIGEVDSNTAKFNTGKQRLPIRVRLSDAARSDLDAIRALRVPTASGVTVPLSAVADIDFRSGSVRIERLDRERKVSVVAQLDGMTLGAANAAIKALPVMQALPEGVGQPATGDTESMNELFASFGIAIVAGIGLIFSVLVLLFRSFFKPITILAALPLSIAGAVIGLILTGSELGLSALIGLLMLMGLAAKNSILLVEFVIEAERDGMPQREAILQACRERARPIVMTTVAMAAGMVPTALSFGEGSAFRAPMAIAVIGGLITSTLLSLVLVPVVYEIVDDMEMWLKPRLGRLVGGPDESDDEETETGTSAPVAHRP